ncbi:hypothetical protein CARUB_v10022314mg [Capsella rubella]|uniref:FBD domain-containing protein n=1 Tax=Capsella rubella TaxID=81985 RepID=R0IDH5_9BRAS|nr:putative F-box/FBD/LRR-repeat protein At1g66300 [Capsella rubella]EOA34743.1 hypothetical protein CARUB_v10022314mg [Capsella rubella]
MDEERRKRVRANASGGEVDWLRNLPEALQWHVLLNLPTKDVVKTSIIYSKWRHLWRYVPGLDLDCRNFKEYNVVVSFIDKFLSFNSESALKKFKLRYNCVLDRQVTKETKTANLMRWINDVVNRKVQHLDVWWGEVDMPPTLYKCESLVSLKLAYAILPNPESVSLPSVKVLDLIFVKFANDLAFERLISGCICLENLTLDRSHNDNVRVLQVSSKSLLSFRYNGSITKGPHDDLVVSIDTPKLEELQLSDHLTASFIIADLSSLVEADINVQFNFCFGKKFNPLDLPKGKMIHNFLVGISNAKNMIISPATLEVIYDASRCEPLPLFANLSSLSVHFDDDSWESLPKFMESCPNLSSLVVESATFSKEGASIVTGPWRLLSSLEYVEIESPLEGDEIEMEFVRYLLENSPILKKVTLYLEKYSRKKSFILIELLKIRRCSTSCEVVVM